MAEKQSTTAEAVKIHSHRNLNQATDKDFTLEELIPGNDLYNQIQPFNPEKIVLCNHRVILQTADEIVVLTEEFIHTNKEKLYTIRSDGKFQDNLFLPTINDFTIKGQKNYRINTDSFNLLQVYTSGDNATLFFICFDESKCTFIRFSEAGESQKISLKCSPYFLKANDIGDVIIAGKDNVLYLLAHDSTQPELLYDASSLSPYKLEKTPSRQEFGIEEEFHWSPNNKLVAFYLVDDSNVPDYPLVCFNEQGLPPNTKTTNIKYPFYEGKSESTLIGILNIESKNCVFIENKESDKIGSKVMNHTNSYWPCLSWSFDSESLYICELDRFQQYAQFKCYNAQNGNLKQLLFEESNDTYIEPEYPFYNLDNDRFVFVSQRSGHKHLYIYHLQTQTIDPLTSGDWDIISVAGYLATENKLLYTSTQNSIFDSDAFAIDITTKVITPLTDYNGTHALYCNEKEGTWASFYTNQKNAGILFAFDDRLDMGNPQRIYHPFVQKTEQIECESYEIGNRKIPKHSINYKVTYPTNYQAGRKYPVVFYVYGGPHVQLIKNSWGSGTKGFEEMMAGEGYFVISSDPITSANRGHYYESSIYGNIGTCQTNDYDYLIDYLKKKHESEMDFSRMAIYGWSFGGFMTISMLLFSRHKSNFAIGIAGGAVTNWNYYETMYTERYCGQSNYFDDTTRDLRKHIQLLNTPLYLIHCDNDPVVLLQNPISFIKQANSNPTISSLIDLYLFPGHSHNVRGPERVTLMKKIKYLIDNRLK